MTSEEAFRKVLKMDFKTVLDIGSGIGVHAELFREAGKEVTTISLVPPADFVGIEYTDLQFGDEKFGCIWASHVLEHQPNVNQFLKKCFSDLADGGILAVTVPPAKDQIVGGHLTLWNEGLLLYNLILAGFDCSEAMVGRYDYNISVIVRKKAVPETKLVMDKGDINTLAPYFPHDAREGFNGCLDPVNW